MLKDIRLSADDVAWQVCISGLSTVYSGWQHRSHSADLKLCRRACSL